MIELLGQEFIKELLTLFFVFFIFLCGLVWKTFSNYLKEKQEHDENVDRKLDKLEEKFDAKFKEVMTQVDVKFEEVSHQVTMLKQDSEETDRVILRGEILDRIERVRDKECIDRDYYEVTLDMYNTYHSKNGNGVVDKEWAPFESKALCSK